MPYLQITEAILVQCNIVNNSYQQCSRVLYAFFPNNLFCQLFDILPNNFILLNFYLRIFIYWSMDYWSKSLEIEDKINITVIINQSVKYKK